MKDRFVAVEQRNRLVCERCDRIHYINPTVVAGTIPASEGKIWLLRRGIEPRFGYWTFPAGFMEMGETVREAALRETMEELALSVDIRDLLGVYSRPSMSTVHVVYLGDALGNPVAGEETLDFALFSPHDVPWNDLAFGSTRDALEDWRRSIT